MEKWMIKNIKSNYKAISEQCNINEVVAKLLVNRGIYKIEDIKSF